MAPETTSPRPTAAQVAAAQILLRRADRGIGARTERLERLARGEAAPGDDGAGDGCRDNLGDGPADGSRTRPGDPSRDRPADCFTDNPGPRDSRGDCSTDDPGPRHSPGNGNGDGHGLRERAAS